MQFQWGQVNGWTNQAKSRVTAFPRWGLPILVISVIPGVLIALLSILLLGASVLALLLLTLPAYKVLVWMAGLGRSTRPEVEVETVFSPGSKPVEVKVLE